MKKVLVATEKPFSPEAVEGIKRILSEAGHEIVLLENYETVDELQKALAEANGVIVRSDELTKELIDGAENLEVIARAGAGVDTIDRDAASAKKIPVMNTPGQNSNAVAELVFGLLVHNVRNQFDGTAGSELMGKKIGIHAFGHVGRGVARIARGFGMEVFAHDPFVAPEDMRAAEVTRVETEAELYATCNIVSLHIPKTSETENSIGKDLVSRMPDGGVLVNTARAEVIDEEGLLATLKERGDLTYLSDIAPETIEAFEKHVDDQCFFTPKKMGAQTAEANVNAACAAANQIAEYFETGTAPFQVNEL